MPEVAAQLRVSEQTAYRWTRSGQLPAVRIGGTVRVPALLLGANPMTTISPHPVQLSNSEPMRAGMSACTGIDGTNPNDGDLDELMIFDKALSQPELNAVIDSLRGKH